MGTWIPASRVSNKPFSFRSKLVSREDLRDGRKLIPINGELLASRWFGRKVSVSLHQNGGTKLQHILLLTYTCFYSVSFYALLTDLWCYEGILTLYSFSSQHNTLNQSLVVELYKPAMLLLPPSLFHLKQLNICYRKVV